MYKINPIVERQLKLQENIVEKLKEKDSSKLRRLASIVSKEEPTMVKEKTEDKLYKVFKEALSDESREEIEKIDSRINEIRKKICGSSGWVLKAQGFWYQDNITNAGDPEVMERDTYFVERTKDGFKPSREETDSWYSNKLRQKEVDFINKYRGLLDEYHNLLNEKDKFMKGNFTLKEDDDGLNESIAGYLKYNVDNSETFSGFLSRKK